MITLTLTGKTYGIKEELKADGFRWNPKAKAWVKSYDNSEKERVERLADAWLDCGVIGAVTQTADSTNKVEKRYRVKQSWIFNLESMHDKIWCLSYDIRDGKIELPFRVAGKTINESQDLFDLLGEAEELTGKAWSSKGVTGREYGRIKEIVAWRVEQRYATCMASGMEESKAGACFEDL